MIGRETTMKKICFLCHGNICRSPMAEFVMKMNISVVVGKWENGG